MNSSSRAWGAVTNLSAAPSLDLRRLVEEPRWIVGAINLDEDLHFSSFYTRQSCKKYALPEFNEFGYSRLVGIYENFNETYFVPEDECVRVGQALLRRIRDHPSWLEEILVRVRRLCDDLGEVFPYSTDVAPFRASSNEDLLALYAEHNTRHTALYQVARIPEALDRGVATFTNYLKEYLRNRSPELADSPARLNRVFLWMTYPEEIDPATQETAEFYELLREVKSSAEGQSWVSGGARRAWLHLPPPIIEQISAYRDKWRFWGYHGFGTRTVLDINDYQKRLSEAIEGRYEEFYTRAQYAELLSVAEKKRIAAFREYRVDDNHQLLFRLHSRVGITKLYRRFVQLRNFCYLDQLIVEVARRLGCSEAELRCLLPEEVESLLRTKSVPTDEQRRRLIFALHVIDGQTEAVLGGEEFRWVKRGLEQRNRTSQASASELRGTVVSPGVAKGRAKIINRREDAERVHFQKGDILVSESTDPDLFDILLQAGGVATEAGGVTSHAAIVARTYAKPAVVGIPNLLSLVANDDFVVLDADSGVLSIVRMEDRRWTIPDEKVAEADAALVGNKALNLARLVRSEVQVPRFFVVPLDAVGREVRKGPPDAAGGTWRGLSAEIAHALEYLKGSMFIIRSSVEGEDSKSNPHAGEYDSFGDLERQDVVAALTRHVERLISLPGPELRGSVIVQEMILGDVSGVCFTEDPLANLPGRMVLEAVPGGNDVLTDGRVLPIRYIIDKAARTVVRDRDSNDYWQTLLGRDLLERLHQTFTVVEKTFGAPQDVEWTVKGRTIWVLQSRPIVFTSPGRAPKVDGVRARRRVTPSRDVASIYAAYRVPPGIRLHMLRVAAVGSWVLDRWKGPPVDHETIVLTLLVHDIGNIVKADIDKYPVLFSEDLQDLPYWRAVQTSIRERYGGTDQQATLTMAKEIGVSPEVLALLDKKIFVKNEETARSSDWGTKIAAYADQRVAPLGVLPLRERLMEAKHRYEGVPTASVNNPRWPRLLECATEIERQLQGKIGESVDNITDESIAPYIDTLRNYRLPDPGTTRMPADTPDPLEPAVESDSIDAESRVRLFLSGHDELKLSKYRVVGAYTRYNEAARNLLKDFRQKIARSLTVGYSTNFLLWGQPGTGKTFFVRELGVSLGQSSRFVEINLAEIAEEEFRKAVTLLGDSSEPTLCLIDEIDSHSAESWPYEALIPIMERSGGGAKAPCAFVLAGSSGGGVAGLLDSIKSRPKGSDLSSRIPEDNLCAVPSMTPEDRILVALSNLRRASIGRPQPIMEVEKLALYYMSLRPGLENARQLRDFTARCIDRVLPEDERVKYDNLFAAGDPENHEFWQRAKVAAPGLFGSFLQIVD